MNFVIEGQYEVRWGIGKIAVFLVTGICSWGAAEARSRLIAIGESHFEDNRHSVYLQLIQTVQAHMTAPFCFLMETQEEPTPFRDGWPWREASALGVTVMGIDMPFSERHFAFETDIVGWVNERDAYMATRIHRLFSEGTCASAILVNGRKHYKKFQPERVTLPELLASLPVPQIYMEFSALEKILAENAKSLITTAEE